MSDETTRSFPNLAALRKILESQFSADTSVDERHYRGGSDGHCAAVATIIYFALGGELISTNSERISHWYNRLVLEDGPYDIDLTGDQFGHAPVRVVPAGDLYSDGAVRDSRDVNESTLLRARRLAERAGLTPPGRYSPSQRERNT